MTSIDIKTQIRNLRSSGVSAKKLSKQFNVSISAIYLWTGGYQPRITSTKKCKNCDVCFKSVKDFCTKKCWIEYKNKQEYPSLKIDYFVNIDLPEKAYWLGFLYADGHVYDHPNRTGWVDFILSVKDEDRIDAFIQAIGLDNSYKYYRKNGNSDQVGVRIGHQQFRSYLIRQGCIPRKRKKITFPEIECKYELPFILGYIDGDGCLSGKSLSVTSGSKKFLEQIKEKLKITGAISEDKRGNICYTLYINVSARKKIYDSYIFSMRRKRII